MTTNKCISIILKLWKEEGTKMNKNLNLNNWGLKKNSAGELMISEFNLVDIAKEYGTPLHVINESRLYETAIKFKDSFEKSYQGKVSIHYAFKCNSVPAVVQTIKNAGLKAEVMTEFELMLALRLGYRGEEIIVNGPCKTNEFLKKCMKENVWLIIVDSLEELNRIKDICEEEKREIKILLRVNPDYIPGGMNNGTATGSRKRCAFGFDLKGGEVQSALNIIRCAKRINFLGYHFHIGTGIRDPKDFSKGINCLKHLLKITQSIGFPIRVIDAGGGIASMTTRELSTKEFLLYQGFDRLPSDIKIMKNTSFEDFAKAISGSISKIFPPDNLPLLILEPGRSIASPNQLLLLTVHYVKHRPKIGKWLITDGGLGTVSMPTYYEYHEVFLCNDINRPDSERVNIIGPACFAGDIIYKNKFMPEVKSGEILAIMDSGAYFTALESSFGFPHPAIVSINNFTHRLVRRRETYEEMLSRDEM
jgi:diaminopimelate decarboxylase